MFRPFASTFLLVLLLYNAFGYYALLAYDISQTRQFQLQELPDDAFSVVKIPVALYTHVEDTDFEYLEDVISYHGKTYNMVKKRVKNDTLHIYTLRNYRHEQAVSQLNSYVKDHITIEKNSTKSTPTKKLIQALLKDYIQESVYSFCCSPNKIVEKRHQIVIALSDKLTSVFLPYTTPPPEVG
jgi:hypothetical protein